VGATFLIGCVHSWQGLAIPKETQEKVVKIYFNGKPVDSSMLSWFVFLGLIFPRKFCGFNIDCIMIMSVFFRDK